MVKTTRFLAIAAITALLTNVTWAGSIVGWGSESNDQLADIPSGNDFVDIASYDTIGLALRADGSIAAWGKNDWGEVSDAPIGTGYQDIAAGFYTGFAIDSTGAIVGWGAEDGNELTDIPTGTNFIQISTAGYAIFALDADGYIHSWGSNHDDDYHPVRDNIPIDGGYTKITSFDYSAAYALAADGSISAWGYPGQEGLTETPTDTGFKDIVASEYGGIAIAADGTLVAWGEDIQGIVSDLPSGNDFVQVGATNLTAFAVRSDGTIAAWGLDEGSCTGCVNDTPTDANYSAVFGGYSSGYALTAESEDNITVDIDIKPWSSRNTIYLRWQRKFAVVIFSDESFDATTIDPGTVELAGAAVATRRRSSGYLSWKVDMNRDGLQDLFVMLKSKDLDPASLQDGYATLTGATYDGEEIEGEDLMRIVP